MHAPALALARLALIAGAAASIASAQPANQPATQPAAAPANRPFAQPPAARPAPDTTLTIYSTATPGAIPASAYRPTPPSMGGFGGYGNPWQGRPMPGYAVVKQERPVALQSGRSIVQFTDVAALLDPTTVRFESLTAPGTTRVIEQSYQFDLVSSQKMLERYVGQAIEVDGRTVTLLSAAPGGLVLREKDGQVLLLPDLSKAQVRFPALSAGLVTTPTLVWDVATDTPGEHRTRVSYQTEGMTWWTDYNLVFAEGADANSGILDVGAWVSILNQSGASYENARLKLVAGDVHRAPQPGRGMMYGVAAAERAPMADAVPGFEQKSFFEYHLYTLGRPTTIPENSTKQIELFDSAKKVPAEKVLLYYGQPEFMPFYGAPMLDRNLGNDSNKKVDIYLRFKNTKENGLGVPLPSGRIRVSKLDAADQSLEFIGEDVMDHTPQGEDVLVKMGSAFDVVGERTQLDFSGDERARRMDETIQVKVRNRKKEPVNVIIKETMHRWTNWEIIQKNADVQKIDARTVHFPVRIEPDKEAVVTYKVRYTW